MKRVLALILSVVMIFILVGCGNETSSTGAEKDETTTTAIDNDSEIDEAITTVEETKEDDSHVKAYIDVYHFLAYYNPEKLDNISKKYYSEDGKLVNKDAFYDEIYYTVQPIIENILNDRNQDDIDDLLNYIFYFVDDGTFYRYNFWSISCGYWYEEYSSDYDSFIVVNFQDDDKYTMGKSYIYNDSGKDIQLMRFKEIVAAPNVSDVVGYWVNSNCGRGPDSLTLYDDGTGIIDGDFGSWSLDLNEFIFHGSSTRILNYYIINGILYLEGRGTSVGDSAQYEKKN